MGRAPMVDVGNEIYHKIIHKNHGIFFRGFLVLYCSNVRVLSFKISWLFSQRLDFSDYFSYYKHI
jgi:hypothetical protein